MASKSRAELYLYIAAAEDVIDWDKSAEKAKCRKCRKKGDDSLMLLCDGCDTGYHTYCLEPPLDAIPEGEWYCTDCVVRACNDILKDKPASHRQC
jgi:hypothetical protein